MATEALNLPEALCRSAPAATPSFVEVLFAPVVGIYRPAAAARTLAAASPAAFWTVFAPLALAYAVALASAPILVEMSESPHSAPTITAAWQALNRGSRVGPVEVLFLCGLLLLPGLAALASWLTLTRTIRSEPFLAAAGRMFRAQSSLALFTLLIAELLLALALGTSTRYDHWVRQFISLFVHPEPFTMVTGLLLGLWLKWRVEIAASALENDGLAPELQPVCERCGYDLSHTAADGRCTECGGAVVDSLVPGRTRFGSDWENDSDRSAGAWLRTTGKLLAGPRRFYETLRMQTDLAAARRFAVMHLRWIGLLAAAWIVLVTLAERMVNRWARQDIDERSMHAMIALAFGLALALATSLGRFAPWRPRALFWAVPAILFVLAVRPELERATFRVTEVYWMAAFALCLTQLVCWFGHRVGGAIVSSLAIFFRVLPDFRRAEKVILYESVVLWLYCTAWGGLATSFILFGDWMRKSVLFRWIWDAFGILPEFFAVLSVTVAISLLWARRYLIAFRSVRWANF